MVSSASLNETLPASLQTGLDRFCDELQNSLGEKLVSIVLYGGLAVGEYSPTSSDVNVMVVLKAVSIQTLDQLAEAVQQRTREFHLSLLVLSEENLRRSTDVFPIKFLDMQRRHRILYGTDVLSELQISRDHLRLRCEQEIKNLMLRLHQFYLQRRDYSEQIENTLSRAVSSFVRALGVLIELKTSNIPSTTDDVIISIEELGLDTEPVRKVLALKRRELQPDAKQLKQLYGSFMQFVQKAGALADQL